MDFDSGEYGIAFISKYDVKKYLYSSIAWKQQGKRQVLAARLKIENLKRKSWS